MHEQSETVGGGNRWWNVYGRNTSQAGQRLPLIFPSEQENYPDAISASQAAALRSLLTREDERPYVPSPRPQVPLDFGVGARMSKQPAPRAVLDTGIAQLFRLLGLAQ